MNINKFLMASLDVCLKVVISRLRYVATVHYIAGWNQSIEVDLLRVCVWKFRNCGVFDTSPNKFFCPVDYSVVM